MLDWCVRVMVLQRKRIDPGWLPTWHGVIEKWTLCFIRDNKWRCSSLYDFEDLIQEARILYWKCERYYPYVIDPPHFMALFKSSLQRLFFNLADRKRKTPDTAKSLDDVIEGQTEALYIEDNNDFKTELSSVLALLGFNEEADLVKLLHKAAKEEYKYMLHMSAIEHELLRLTGVDPEAEYQSRQVYLNAVFIATHKIGTEEYDAMTEEAYEWCRQAQFARQNKTDLPEFDTAFGVTQPRVSLQETEADKDYSDRSYLESAEQGDHQEFKTEGTEYPEPEKPKKKKGGRTKKDKAVIDEPDGNTNKPTAPKKSHRKVGPPDKNKHRTGEIDEFGCAVGTYAHTVVMMAARLEGVTTKQMLETFGRLKVNPLRAAAARGHILTKEGSNPITYYLRLKPKEEVTT